MNGFAELHNSFLHSAQARHNRFQDFADTQRWLQELRAQCATKVERIPLADMAQWYVDACGDLRHRSGKFFRIAGLHCHPVNGARTWEQPIILQPEIGILGILTRVFDGTRYFLMQAKMEPGNAHLVQLSPTLQATFSNYSQAHKGNLPPYTQYFLDPDKQVINCQLQSETGTRFYRKFNHNTLLDLEEDVEVLPGFRWLTLYEIQRLAAQDDTLNMDSRSVLSNIAYCGKAESDAKPTQFQRSAASDPGTGCNSVADLRAWLLAARRRLALDTTVIALKAVRDWVRDDWGIRHATRNYFEVAGVRVQGAGREVKEWCQPLLRHEGLGLSGFVCAEIDGVLHFLMQAKAEPGIADSVEIAPTVSLFDYRNRAARGATQPYLDTILQAPAPAILHASIQSEEGGRFWNLRNHVLVVQVPDAAALRINDNHAWMTLAQLRLLAQGTSLVNSEARTLLSCLPMYE